MMLSPLLFLRPDTPPAASPPGAQPPFAPEMPGFPDLSTVATLLSGAAAPPRQFPALSGKNLPPAPEIASDITPDINLAIAQDMALPETAASPAQPLPALPDDETPAHIATGDEPPETEITPTAPQDRDTVLPAAMPSPVDLPAAPEARPRVLAALPSVETAAIATPATPDAPAPRPTTPAIETPPSDDGAPERPDAPPTVVTGRTASVFTPPADRSRSEAPSPPAASANEMRPAGDTQHGAPVPIVGASPPAARAETRESPPVAPPAPATPLPAPPAARPASPVDASPAALPRAPEVAATTPPPDAPSEPRRAPDLPARADAPAPDRAPVAASAAIASVSGTAQALRTRPNTAFAPALGEAAPPAAATLPILPLATAPTAMAEAPAPAATPIDTRDPHWVETMIDRIETLRDASGVRETRLRLTPDALGAVEVRIAETPDGVRVHLTADSASARQLLAEAAPRLAEMAEARGLKLAQDGAQQSPQHQQQSQPHDRGQPLRNRMAARPEHPLHPSDDDRIA